VVKGVNLVDLRDAGDPVEMARVHDAEGADEAHGPERAEVEDARKSRCIWIADAGWGQVGGV